MKTLKYMEGLNSEDTLKRITSKLPSSVGVRWCRFANKMLESEERLATFHYVVKFVTQEAALATDPVFSLEALKEARKNEFTSSSSNTNGRRVKSASSFSTNPTPPEEQSSPCSSCPFCNSQHHSLENCSSARRRLLKKEKRLFKKQEYVSVVSTTATCQEDVETGRCAKLVVCPTRPFFMMKARFLPSIVVKTKQELCSQPKQLAAAQVPVMLLEPPIPLQTL